jgi:hypothetical protein
VLLPLSPALLVLRAENRAKSSGQAHQGGGARAEADCEALLQGTVGRSGHSVNHLRRLSKESQAVKLGITMANLEL